MGRPGDLGDGKLTMEVYTNQPSLQFYSGNWLTGTPDRQGRPYRDYDGFCLEAQQLPDSPNRPALGDPGCCRGSVIATRPAIALFLPPDSPARADEGARARRHVMAAPAPMAPPNQPE